MCAYRARKPSWFGHCDLAEPSIAARSARQNQQRRGRGHCRVLITTPAPAPVCQAGTAPAHTVADFASPTSEPKVGVTERSLSLLFSGKRGVQRMGGGGGQDLDAGEPAVEVHIGEAGQVQRPRLPPPIPVQQREAEVPHALVRVAPKYVRALPRHYLPVPPPAASRRMPAQKQGLPWECIPNHAHPVPPPPPPPDPRDFSSARSKSGQQISSVFSSCTVAGRRAFCRLGGRARMGLGRQPHSREEPLEQLETSKQPEARFAVHWETLGTRDICKHRNGQKGMLGGGGGGGGRLVNSGDGDVAGAAVLGHPRQLRVVLGDVEQVLLRHRAPRGDHGVSHCALSSTP